MLTGFIFWYRGTAQGAIASVGQLQLLQPLLGSWIAALLLGKSIAPSMLATAVLVLAYVAGARRLT